MPVLLIVLGGVIAGALVARGGAGKRATRKLAKAARTNREPRRIKLEAHAKLLQERYLRRHPKTASAASNGLLYVGYLGDRG